ncbi:MAG: hypothetical protein MJB14_11980 [Spirochaetes bacterium]|nr:hypothetical protein [Spirochaetota bacterium]
MDKKNEINNPREIFSHEYTIIKRIHQSLEKITNLGQLKEEYKILGHEYEALLKLVQNITILGDSYYKKLHKLKQELQDQQKIIEKLTNK